MSDKLEFKKRYLAAKPGTFVPYGDHSNIEKDGGMSILKPPPTPDDYRPPSEEDKKIIDNFLLAFQERMNNPFSL